MQDVFRKLSLSKITFEDVKDEEGNIIDSVPQSNSRDYLLVFNINVIETIEERYGTDERSGFEVWSDEASESGKGQYSKLAEFLCLCVNEGIHIENRHRKEVNLPLLEKFDQEEINIDVTSLLSTVTDLVKASTKTGSSKN